MASVITLTRAVSATEPENRVEINVNPRRLDGTGDLGEKAAVVAVILGGVVVQVGEIGLRRAQRGRNMAQRADLAVDGVERMS